MPNAMDAGAERMHASTLYYVQGGNKILRKRRKIIFHADPLHIYDRRNNGFINMLRTMKAKAISLGGESALRAAVEQAMPAEIEEEAEQQEGGTMATRIADKYVKGLFGASSSTRVFVLCFLFVFE